MIPPNKFFLAIVFSIMFTLPLAFALDSYSSEKNTTDLGIDIDLGYKVAKTGDTFNFSSLTSYGGKDSSPPIVVAMNIVNLEDGAPVDPEDWSPQRTQLIETIKHGESIKQNWTIHSILDGNYLIYLVAIPKPGNVKSTSLPISSSAVHLTVKPFIRFNPGGVLPVIFTIPIILTLFYFGLRYLRKRDLD